MRSMLEMYSAGTSATSSESASRQLWSEPSLTRTASGPAMPTADSKRMYFSPAGPLSSYVVRVHKETP